MTEAERRGDLARLAAPLLVTEYTWSSTQVPAAEGIARLLRLIELAEAQGPSPDLAQLYLSLAYQYMSRMAVCGKPVGGGAGAAGRSGGG